ncbi:hypothetical protein [Pseudomonas fulva]|uniref:hypothetical protein n=1 Tax=Pseudomonas fulva TaxID=47880 RepID=UPI001F1C66FF|nr:hypothetical protein [Pseudomonas fulva]
MPTENRSTELRDLFIKLNPLGLDDKDLRVDGSGFEHPATDNEFTAFRAGHEAAQQVQQGQCEPMPAFENCIDARAYIGDLFRQRLRRHDFDQYIAERLAGDFAFALANWLVTEGNGDPAEVERLRAELRRWKGVAETLQVDIAKISDEGIEFMTRAKRSEAEVDQLQRRIQNAELALQAQTQNCRTLRVQLAEAHAVLQQISDAGYLESDDYPRIAELTAGDADAPVTPAQANPYWPASSAEDLANFRAWKSERQG